MTSSLNFKRLIGKSLTVVFLLLTCTLFAQGDHGHEIAEHAEHVAAHDDSGHHPDVTPLFFIIIAILIGAATRHFLKKLPFPFTVLLLLIGLGLGAMERLGYFHLWHLGSAEIDVSIISKSLQWAANIDPHLLLFVFLPVLIFEAAFAMDVHTFKKSAWNAVILAVPGIIIAMLLTAGLVYGIDKMDIGLPGWANWTIALMFGAVISATDPVAVVALLKELGASKKLGTLIEGESLLNDGTAIVIFMVFFGIITGAGGEDVNPVIEFVRVSFGGILVGLVLGYIVLRWVRKVFNDALVEISAVVGAAFMTFFICEHFFHVSGVLGLVALGLMIGGVGRSRISPQVEHFMHEFWELAGFIANSMIFLIVGVVIAERTVFTVNDFVVLGIIFVGLHVVRAIVIAMFYPIMRKLGYGLPKKDAVVVWYGALRGAIGLALALIVAGVGDQFIAPEIKNQFLFLTAGTVTLTLLVNATTIKYIVNALGLTKLPPAKALMVVNAHQYLRQTSEIHLDKLKTDRYMKRANWDAVSQYLPNKVDSIEKVDEIKVDAIAEIRRRLLEKEKSSYWHQFKNGLLGPIAVRRLNDGIMEVLDQGGKVPLSERPDLEEQWETPKLIKKLNKYPLLRNMVERIFFDRMTRSFDCAVGFVEAQSECLKLVESMHRAGESEDILKTIEEEINENIIHGQTFIRNLRKNYPDIFKAIATRQAIRSILNYEQSTIERLLKKGQISGDEAGKMESSLKERTKRLFDSPPEIEHDNDGNENVEEKMANVS